jgi:hypothetical protein
LVADSHAVRCTAASPGLLLLLQEEFDERRHYIKPTATGATEGHALGAQRTMAKAAAASSGRNKHWKMPRFKKNAQSKIVRYMYSRGSGQEAYEQQQHFEEQQVQQVFEQRDQEGC